jgi:hypothetical protein
MWFLVTNGDGMGIRGEMEVVVAMTTWLGNVSRLLEETAAEVFSWIGI